MSRLLLITLLLLSHFVYAQPAGYVPGTQVCWKINGYDHGYFKAAGNGERHILISFTGYGETSCANYQTNAPQNLLNDLGPTNWDGRTVRGPGDTIVWEILTVPNYAENWMDPYNRNIDSFFARIAPIDTSNHARFHISGLSHGVGRFWGYLSGAQGNNSPYRHIFSTTISLSGQQQDSTMIANTSPNRRHWVWVGADDGGQTAPNASLYNYNNMSGAKRWTLQQSTPGRTAGHNSVTWDSCHSLRGLDSNSNTWLWMVTPPGGPVVQPCDTLTGGPAGYVPGTQVGWVFNGRQHGYFRAAGCGERHVLIAFTDDSIVDTSNYQLYSPQKLLADAGLNWNGRTVRAPGDTIIWEVLTIFNTSNYWLQDYTNDINYFFQHSTGLDTTNRSRFHIAGVAYGVGRMWGYLTNDQNNVSPYRGIFSTTISVATTWTGIHAKIAAASAGKRHWVWHGASDTNPNMPPSASVDLYNNALTGNKRITLQTGGGHDATTYDSCFSLLGSDSSNNRWLWMVTPPASGLRSFITTTRPVQDKPAVQPASIKLWPNPASGHTKINWNGQAAATYRITLSDGTGRARKTWNGVRNNSYILDLSGLEKGIYFVKIEGAGEKNILRLAVQ